MALVSRHTVEYRRTGPVHIYEVALFTREGELARMNGGEYCDETRVLIVAPDHCILAIDNDAIDESHEVDAEMLGFDPQYPDHENTIRAVGDAIAADAARDDSETGA